MIQPPDTQAPGSETRRIIPHAEWRCSPEAAEGICRTGGILVTVPHELHPDSKQLVQRFAEELGCKLRAAEEKYGYSDGWLTEDWETECREHLIEHLGKGDPRDVAIYAAFMWARSWSTAAPPRPEPSEAGEMPDETLDQELRRLVLEYRDGSSNADEAWNLIADFAECNCDAICSALASPPPTEPTPQDAEMIAIDVLAKIVGDIRNDPENPDAFRDEPWRAPKISYDRIADAILTAARLSSLSAKGETGR